MRCKYVSILIVLTGGVLLWGCAPPFTESGDGVLGAVASSTYLAAGSGGTDADEDPAVASPKPSWQFRGTVHGTGDYQLFELGSGLRGEEWTLTGGGYAGASAYLVVLFDANHDLLRRQIITGRSPLRHVIRADTPTLYAGVTPAPGSDGGSFDLAASRGGTVAVPGPAAQLVWVNFGPASDVRVHRRAPISFAAFDAGVLGSAYAGHSAEMKAAILSAMREDYADYNVVIMSSDEGPPPGDVHSVIHLGGNDSRLLGLADNVDQYNSNPAQAAVVYVESFAVFDVMKLSVAEMGQMIGNTASHELGHLLGLYHTTRVDGIMDTTGSAWDLVEDQAFKSGELEPSVFPMGYENSPARLAETVGYNPSPPKQGVAKHLDAAKILKKARLRALVRQELRCRCGNCLNPDE